MKNTLVTSLIVCAAAFCLCGCASEKGQQNAQASSPAQVNESSPTNQTIQTNQTSAVNQPAEPKPAQEPEVKYPGQDRLKAGMTTDEVVQAIGNPLGHGDESDGSQFWTYNHWDTPPGTALSPVNPTVLVLTVVFDRHGKVLSWYTRARHAY